MAMNTAVRAALARGRSASRAVVWPVLICAGYYGAGALSLSLRFQPGGIAGIGLHHGVLLAALVLSPLRRWWLLAALLLPTHVHLSRTFQAQIPMSVSFIQFAANVVQAALGAAMLRRIVGQEPRLNLLSAMTRFILVGTVLAPLLVSGPVAWLFTVAGWADDFWLTWERRAFSGMCGAVIVAPAIMDLASGGLRAAWHASRRRRTEYLMLSAALASVLAGLLAWHQFRVAPLWLLFAPLPVLLWSAARFGPGGLGPHLLATTLVALVKLMAGSGPFHMPAGDAVLALQASLLVVTIPMMLLSALVQQHARTARALRHSEARYRSVVDDQTELICRYRPDGTLTFVNGACSRHLERPVEDLIGRSLWDLIPVAEHPAARAHLAAITPARPVVSAERAVRSAGNGTRWHHWTDRGLFDERGQVVEYQSVGHDITERKQAEEAARNSENQIRLFIQQTPAAVAMFDRQMRYLSYSQRWLSDYRLGDQNLVGRSHYEVFPEVSAYWKEIHRRCLAGAVDTCEESPFTRQDGSLDWIRWEIRPWHNLQQEIGGLVMLTEVITDRKRAQDEHRQLLAERRVAEALREVDRRKDEFLAMLAHELRNPLAPICTAVEVLRNEQPASETVVWAGDVIARQSAQLSRLVDDLLDVSRITLGKVKLELARLDLAAIVTQAVEATRPLLTARRQQLAIQVPSNPLPVLGDGVRLIQIVSNLLNNASRYTAEGGRIALSVEQAGTQVVLRVTDNGIGIPPDMLERVFEMFTQLEGPGSRLDGGLGIGLAVARRLLEMHQGSIEAHSAGPGRGSEFLVRLPLALPTVQADRGAAGGPVDKRPDQSAPLRPRPRRILVVDDNIDAAETVCRLLRRRHHEVMVVHDGLAALAAARQMNPDVILLDLGLPKMDGLAVARQLRQRDDGPRPLLVATTGFGQAEDRARTAAAGFDHHLIKPIDLQELHALVQAAG
jgi:PAS domain S-box-containing protein